MGGNVTSAGWQVTLCDPMWHVSSRSSVATLRTAIHLLLTCYVQRSWARRQAVNRPIFADKRLVYGGGDPGAVMPCSWEGNRRCGVALAMRHRLQWFIHLRAHSLRTQGLRKGDEHPAYTSHWVWHSFTFCLFWLHLAVSAGKPTCIGLCPSVCPSICLSCIFPNVNAVARVRYDHKRRIDKYPDTLLADQTARKVKPPTIDKKGQRSARWRTARVIISPILPAKRAFS